MSVTIIGVDCAVTNEDTGVSVGTLTDRRITVHETVVCSRQRTVARTVVDWLMEWSPSERPALLAIDAPLGWPMALGESLAGHFAGAAIKTEADHLFRRATDRCIQSRLGKTPLDVGADRIARTAHAALRLLGTLRRELGRSIPLAWEVNLKELSAIEVYPAATLIAHGISATGYKKPQQVAAREAIVDGLRTHLVLPEETPLLGRNADALDSLLCVLAGADFLNGDAVGPLDEQLARKEGWIWAYRSEAAEGS